MRALLVLPLVLACSKASPAASPTTVGQLIVPEATGMGVFRPNAFPVLGLLDSDGFDMRKCWRELEEKLTATYQVFVSPSSYAIIVGDLPRKNVEDCVESQLAFNRLLEDDIGHDGELTVVKTKFGTVYAAWRGEHVIIGARDHVVRATTARTTNPPWLLATDLPTRDTFATTAMSAISTDQMFHNILGVPTKRWKLTLNQPSKGWPERELFEKDEDELERFGREQERLAKEKAKAKQDALAPPPPPPMPPPPTFAGRLELEYATATEATQAGETVAKAAFALPLEENLSAALAKLPQKITGSTLTLSFDQSSFPGVELEKLQAWLAALQAQQQQP